jgi:hypothetical protein
MPGDGAPEAAVVSSEVTRDVLQDHPCSVYVNPPIESRVAGLLPRGGPSAVARFVVAVDIDAVKRVSRRRTRANVSQKRGEVRAPARVDLDSTAAVVGKLGGVGIFAPADCAAPRPVLLGWRPVARGPVRCEVGRDSLRPDTAATVCPDAEFVGDNDGRSAAVTQAFPRHALSFSSVWASANNKKSADSFAGSVAQLSHTSILDASLIFGVFTA